MAKASTEGPTCEEPPGVGFAIVAAGDRTVAFKPAREQWIETRPPKGRVVAVTRGEHTTVPQHAPHFSQVPDRVAQVLQELIRTHHFERSVWEWQRVHIADT